jgi:DNA invertase Pin-like site-specific DNA recombinase
VTRVDRLSRSLADFAGLVDRARREGWLVIAVDSPFDMSTAPGRAMAGVMATFSELERELISERTRAALKVKADQLATEGKRLGRPLAISAEAEHRIRELRVAGLSYKAIAAALTAEGLPTPQTIADSTAKEKAQREGKPLPAGRGGDAWHWRTVYTTVKRIGVLKGGKAPKRRRRRRKDTGL